MKKFFMFLTALVMSVTMFAQEQTNFAGSSKFTDNWSVTLQGGVLTQFDNFFSGHTATAPIVVLGADKYLTPWFGVGVEGRTLIGTGNGMYNTHTAFDAVNVSGYAKFNLVNMFKFDGTRKLFEPVAYTGIGWGHQTCSDVLDRNYMTYRAGVEFNFNLGKQRAWAVVVNPSVVWGDIDNGRLVKSHGNFEVTAGVVYHFKNSNGKRSFSKARLYDAAEVVALNARIAELEARKPEVVTREVVREVVRPVTNAVATVKNQKVAFKVNADNIDAYVPVLEDVIAQVNSNSKVYVKGYASVEGDEAYNKELSLRRATAVKNKLVSMGMNADQIVVSGEGETDQFSKDAYEPNRVVVITVE